MAFTLALICFVATIVSAAVIIFSTKKPHKNKKWFSTATDGPMTLAQYKSWMNDRACDGCWDSPMAILCINVHSFIEGEPKSKQEAAWVEFRDENPQFIKQIEAINLKIQSMEGEFES